MTRINLLPPEIKEKAARPNLLPLLILPVLGAVALVVVLWLLFHGQVAGKQDELKKAQEEVRKITEQVDKPLQKYESQRSELQKYQNLYNKCNAGRVAWASMLNDLALYVPEGLTTASNPRAPAIWLVSLTIDATPLEQAGGAPVMSTGTTTTSGAPIRIEGFAAPAWLCIQTWLPRASDFRAHGFLDAYPYYYYFRGQPKVAEFFTRLHNMEEWSNLWIDSSTQEPINAQRQATTVNDDGTVTTEIVDYQDWAIHFFINAFWNPEQAIWANRMKSTGQAAAGSATSPTPGGEQK